MESPAATPGFLCARLRRCLNAAILRNYMTRPPLLIAQVSDLHVKRPGELAYGRVDTAAAARRLVAALEAFAPRPDIVVISGDLVDGGTAEEYAHLLELLAPLTIPLLVTPGNHDSREPMRAAFPAQAFERDAALNQIRRVKGCDIVLLDSSVPGKPHGELDGATLAWLERQLAGGDVPALLFLHHPPFAMGVTHMDRQNLLNAGELAEIVRRHTRVQIVAAGHCHRAVIHRFAGITATICPAPSHTVALDLDESLPPSFAIEPPAFHLHVWFGSELGLVTHQVPVGPVEGPYPFRFRPG
jgi:3',5'-cyclic-AMP phosphodiesterase